MLVLVKYKNMKVPVIKETSILGRERMINRDTKKDNKIKAKERERKRETKSKSKKSRRKCRKRRSDLWGLQQ